MSEQNNKIFYRLRSLKSIFEYKELENQEIYFASLDELNDPMEGFRNIVFKGDKIVWQNLFRHYFKCLEWICRAYALGGEKFECKISDFIPLYAEARDFPTPMYRESFDKIYQEFIQVCGKTIKAISRRTTAVSRKELLFYLSTIHYIALGIIQRYYIEQGFIEYRGFDYPKNTQPLAMVITMATTKTGLVPDEDTGVIFCTVSMAPGTSQERTKEVVNQIDKMLASNPAVKTREQLLGYNFIAGQGSDQATFIVKLKPFEERPAGFFYNLSGLWQGDGIMRFFVNPMSYTSVLGMIYKQTAEIKDAQILAFAPPMVNGFGATNGITFSMQDKTGGDLNKFFEITKKYLAELNKRPEISNAMTSYNPNYPQYMVDVDVAKCKQSGISPQTVLSTLQGYYGGMYASNFNSYGKLYRVMIQGTVDSRKNPATMSSIYVRTPKGMAPVSEYCSLRRVYGPSNINRFNLFTCINVNATAATGYSSGQALQAVEEVAAQVLPQGYGLDYSGMTRSEQESSDSTAIIFALCLVFVYLILSAQYESYILPLAVILSIPFGLAGAFIFTNIFGHSNAIYMQIALIMLIGLLAKNAILIVQFALERRQMGMAIKYSAILGAAARLRPILMTSLAMIIGLLPLMFASGVGKNGNQTLGAAAVGGMLLGTLLQVFIVPALFAVFQWLQERISPMKFADDEAHVDSEIKQFANPYAAAELQKLIEKRDKGEE